MIKRNRYMRYLGMVGLAGLFLITSPRLRIVVYDHLEDGYTSLQRHSPYSYVILAVVALISALIYVRRSSVPRT
jgi:hypothetical protein